MSIDLVLVNPRVIGETNYPALSLLCLAAYARREGYSVAIIDAQAETLSDQEVSARVAEYDPILCGITFMTHQAEIVRKLVARIKESKPDIKLVAGGIHVSILPHESKTLGFDFCVVGEGEVTLVQLLSALKSNSKVDNIEGLWTSDTSQFKPRKVIDTLDSLPVPAWDLVPVEKFTVGQPDLRYTQESGVCLTIAASRGCPYNCTFCSSHGVYGYSHRTRSPSHVVDEMEMLYKDYGVSKFFLVDESILAKADRAEQFAEEIMKRQLRVQFASSARVNDRGVNPTTLKKLREAGMVRVDFGVESGSQRILNDIRKGITVEQIVRAHRAAHEAGMQITSLMMSGHLEETWEDALDSLELVAKIETDYPEFGPMTPYPGTEAYSKALREGWIRDNDWSKYYISNVYRVMRSRHFLYQEIFAMSLLCWDAARLMVRWKRNKPSSLRDFFAITGTDSSGLKPIGRFLVARYMQTSDRRFLKELKLEQLKRIKRIRLLDDPREAQLVIGLRKRPWRVFTQSNRIERIRLLFPVLLERIEERIVIPVGRIYYASALAWGPKQEIWRSRNI